MYISEQLRFLNDVNNRYTKGKESLQDRQGIDLNFISEEPYGIISSL